MRFRRTTIQDRPNDHEARAMWRALQEGCARSERTSADVARQRDAEHGLKPKSWDRESHNIPPAASTQRNRRGQEGPDIWRSDASAERWWILATAQKTLRRPPLRDPHDRAKGATESSKGRAQLATGRFQAVVVSVVVVAVLSWTAWLLVDMLLQVVF